MESTQPGGQPRIPQIMADSLHYPLAHHHYMTPTYFATPHTHAPGHMHVVAGMPRQEVTQRKRPKYTRSKTGCLTCRVKKIKCDEAKPNCMRCTHGQRDCTWPEGVPSRKKSASRKDDDDDGMPTPTSTESSENRSDTSTPPMRNNSPPKREPLDIGLRPLVSSRRHSDPPLTITTVDSGSSRHQSGTQAYPHHPNSNLLAAIPEASSSYSPHLNDGYSNGVNAMHPPIQSRIHSRPSSGHDLPPPQAMAQWAPLTNSPDPLEPYFPTMQQRNLIRHYCDNSMRLIMAVPAENPVIAANLPLILGRAPGSDSATEALRMSLMGVGAIHQSFLLAQSGMSQAGADEMLQLANHFRLNSNSYLAKAVTTVEGIQSDAALGATVAIALIDIFSGGHNWSKNLNLAKTLVNVRGGAAVLLARSNAAKSGGGLSRARLMLEILAVYDLFGCLTTGEELTLLSPEASSWWSDTTDATYRLSYVEKVFGVSRAFIPVLARVVTFISRVLNNRGNITEVVGSSLSEELDVLGKCEELYKTIQDWTPHSQTTLPRVQAGNSVYQSAAQISLLRDVLGVPPLDPRVQQCADNIITLCHECISCKMGVDLTWPAIMAGSQMYGSDRLRVADTFAGFRSQCCYEINTAEQIVTEVWRRLDQDLPRADWRSVIRDFNLSVLII